MKVATAIVNSHQDIHRLVDEMEESTFTTDDLVLIATDKAEQVQAILDEESEKSAAEGAVVGGTLGSALGLAGGLAVLPIPGFGPVIAAGLVSTAAGGAIGTFIGSMFSAEASSQPKYDISEKMEEGNILALIRTDEAHVEEAKDLLERVGAREVASFDLDDDALDEF
jgi:hypothetical protein